MVDSISSEIFFILFFEKCIYVFTYFGFSCFFYWGDRRIEGRPNVGWTTVIRMIAVAAEGVPSPRDYRLAVGGWADPTWL